ncbi:hypothetical protein L208DRAFT_1307441, partial [Tricholoma matsutake]
VQVPRLTSTGGCPCARDYDDITKEYIVVACTLFCVKISVSQGFPDVSEELSLVHKVWHEVGKQLNFSLHLAHRIAKLITAHGAQIHGKLKTKAQPLVETFFGFDSGNHESALKSNRLMVQYLKQDGHFTYKFIDWEEDKQTGVYHSKVIQKIMNVMWFRNQQDEGVQSTDYFEPFLLQALALVLTVIENCIDEWVSGKHVKIDFSGKEYHDIYLGWIRELENFNKYTKKHDLLNKILVKIHNRGRFHARAILALRLDLPKIPYGAFEAAMKEYEEDDNTEMDGERGDSE